MMKKIKQKSPAVNPPNEGEDETTSVDGHGRINYFLKNQLLKATIKAKLGVDKRKASNGHPPLPASLHTVGVDESSDEYYFSMMDSFLSERVIEILEEKKKVDRSNMISSDAKLSEKTPVEVSGCEGMNPSEYAKAQGIAGFKPSRGSIKESDDYNLRFDSHPDHAKYLEQEKSGRVLPKDHHHAGVVMQGKMKVRNVMYHPKTKTYRIGPHEGSTPEDAIKTYMEKTKGSKTIARHVASGQGPIA